MGINAYRSPHHSIKVTVDIYGHLAPEENKAAVDRLDDDATSRNRNGKGVNRYQLTSCNVMVVPRGLEPRFPA